MSDESEQAVYRCPYPDCEWELSRPVDSDVPLTQAVVSAKVKSHRASHQTEVEGW